MDTADVLTPGTAVPHNPMSPLCPNPTEGGWKGDGKDQGLEPSGKVKIKLKIRVPAFLLLFPDAYC